MRQIQILIAEDEKLIRAGVCRMVEDYFAAARPGVLYRILEAGNGGDAYRKCVSEHVDILITDIKMPTLSGVSLAKRLVDAGSPIHILAVSGYQDYDYVRSMLRMGVYDYLIKPINQKQLGEALGYFLDHLDPGQPPPEPALAVEQRLIDYLLLGKGDAREELEALLRHRGLGPDTGCQAFFVEPGRLRREQLYTLVAEACGGYGGVVCIQGEAALWTAVCFYREHLPPEGFPEHLREQLAGGGLQLRSSPLLGGAAQLAGLRTEAAAESFHNLPKAQWCLGEGVNTGQELARLEALVLGGDDPAPLRECVERIFACYQRDKVSREAVKKDFSDLSYRLMQRSADAIEFISKAKFTRHDLTEHLEAAVSLGALQEQVLASLEHLCRQLAGRRKSHGDAVISQVKRYVQENYAADLQLQQAAKQVHLHPNYLSTLFRQETGLTFRDYLRKTRVEAAKEQLGRGVAVSRVAELVGYGDTAHFFRAFKAVTGVTPKVWRSTHPQG